MPFDTTVLSLVDSFQSDIWPPALNLIINVSPIVLALLLAKIFWELWVDYIQSAWFLTLKRTVLELKLPKDTFKSPAAMEIFLISLHNLADGTHFAQYWKGETRPWYSLELVSIEGQVKFLIWTEDRRKNNLMVGLYSQFPGIEVKEVPDYTSSVHFDPDKVRIWAAEFKKSTDSPVPIRTYVEFGLDKDPKEEFKVDPLLPLIEFLGSAGPNTQLWTQILIRGHKNDQRLPGHLFKRGDLWKLKSEELVNKMYFRDPKTKLSGKRNADGFLDVPKLTKAEEETALAIQRSIYKKSFDVGIRTLYICKKDQFDGPWGIGGFISSFAQFGGEGSNQIRPKGDKWHNRIDDPWKDYKNFKRNRYSRLALMAYKRRSIFYPPFKSDTMVMNSEELATIYHFPGSVSQTPTLERIPSKKAQAPANLPI